MKLKQSQKPTLKTKTDIVFRYATIGILTVAIIFAVVFIYSNFISAEESRAEGGGSHVGPGYALTFNGTTDYVALAPPIQSAGVLQQFTVEVWTKILTTPGRRNYTILDYDGQEYFSLYIRGNGKVAFKTTGSDKTKDVLMSAAKVNDGEWHQIAVVYDGTDKHVYIDGKLDATIANPHSGNPIGTGVLRYGFIGVGSQATLYDGSKTGDYFSGTLDEMRLWTAARSLDQVRQTLTEKLQGDEAQLFSYFTLNEGQGEIVTDGVNAIEGALKGDLATSGWTLSGIYMGDQSVYAYDTNQLTFNIPGKGSATVNITSGTPEGIHIYYVGSAPSDNTFPEGIKGFEGYYWGVYVMGTTEYTFTFDFNDYAGAIDLAYLELVQRPNGSGSWVHGNAQRSVDNKLAIPLQTGTEYIPASSETVMPIELLSFDAELQDNDILVKWSTSSEINNDFFTIERSKNGKDYEEVGRVNGSGNTEDAVSYSFVDERPLGGKSYYRLKQTDFDGKFEYFAPKMLDTGTELKADILMSVYPNPSFNKEITVSAEGIPEGEDVVVSMMDLQGMPVYQEEQFASGGFISVKIDPTNISAGNYVVVLKTANSQLTKQVILRK